MDEKRHAGYNAACELGRIDLIHHGLADGAVPLLFMRVNPHVVHGQNHPALVDKVKEVAQFIRDQIAKFDANGNVGALPVTTMQYFFYGEGSEHRELVKHATESVIINPDINVCRPHREYDSDIARFTFAALNDGEIELQEGKQTTEIIRAIIQADSSAPQCSAYDKGTRKRLGTVKLPPCWRNCIPGSDLCAKHYRDEIKGKGVMRYCEEKS